MSEARRVATSPNELMAGGEGRLLNRLYPAHVGKLFMFYYDAEWKGTMPYWDQFPCMLLIDVGVDKKGKPKFWGFNFHYMPPLMRAKILNMLYTDEQTMNRARVPLNKKLRITREKLAAVAGIEVFKFCRKEYFHDTKHVRSRFLEIPFDRWDMAVLLPVERFETKTRPSVTKTQVWQDFRKKT